eukprot:TRINITY_DN7464_c0_g1_i1.p1 TRINITY_DN7464_c0_g1~~TRINITY_DN7464_c0_g1_i1.p1  ORF type:complete len:324 (+),score=63.40 TRINITY_DN7464_c0_g1_i1:58-1029(+)
MFELGLSRKEHANSQKRILIWSVLLGTSGALLWSTHPELLQAIYSYTKSLLLAGVLLFSLAMLSLEVFCYNLNPVSSYIAFMVSKIETLSRRARKPKRIILIRHGQSEGNVNEAIYEEKPDHAILLTDQGLNQAFEAGKKLKEIIGDESVAFYVSPFTRTHQTCAQIMRSFSEAQSSVFEDPRLREQEWGNLQDNERMKEVVSLRDRLGKFFFRFQDGESGADVFDRASDFMASLFRLYEKPSRSPPQNVIIVSHGLFIRFFLMRFYHWTVEQFSQIRNPGNCEFFIMEKDPLDSKYNLVKAPVGAPGAVKSDRELELSRKQA